MGDRLACSLRFAGVRGTRRAAARLEWDSRLIELRSEWEDALAGVQTQTEAAAAHWEATFDALLLEQSRLVDNGMWTRGPSELLGVLGVQHDEVRNCRVLRWLLDPMAPHGLGTHFLGWFMAESGCAVPDDQLSLASVETEVGAGSTRADLVLTTPSITVVVEAKMNAPEAPLQCASIESAWSDSDPRLVFLTRSGRLPHTGTPARWTTISWKQIATGLATSLEACTARGAGRVAAEEYLRSLRGYA